MTNRELYNRYIQQLKNVYDVREATAIATLVFESMAGLQRSDIVKNPHHDLDAYISSKLEGALMALLQHKPVQYVLGETWFYKMKLKVNEQVLIPRPETEELVKLLIENYKLPIGESQSAKRNTLLSKKHPPTGAGSPLSILDIGTGSGCIAIAVKKNLPWVNMYAIDVSEGALSVAEENALHQKADIHFLQLDFLDENNWNQLPVVKVIISNPPYIPFSENGKLERNVMGFEPHKALFVPDHAPLIFYQKIAAFGKTNLSENGKIYVEINEELAWETREVFEPYYSVEIQEDIFGKQRMLVVSRADVNL